MNNFNCLLVVICFLFNVTHVYSFSIKPSTTRCNGNVNIIHNNFQFSDSSSSNNNNADMFGGTGSSTKASTSTVAAPSVSSTNSYYKDGAAKLRQEAAELEVALREEARAKGVPEEMINKLIPITSNKPLQKKVKVEETTDSSIEADTSSLIPSKKTLESAKSIRSKLGYLNTGDAVRMTAELDRVKSRQFIDIWNSKDLSLKQSYDVNNYQLKARTNIDPKQLRLDDVGYNYQNVFLLALFIATVFGFGSTFVGGELGFYLGYLSALLPITLVGLGSIAPALIGDIINTVSYAIDEDKKERYIKQNAAKFLVGYVVGLPIAKFTSGSPSNTCEFFQLRPRGKSEIEDKQMFTKKKFSQLDISRSSVVCIAGSVGECISYGEASGTNPGDINTLNELMSTVEPILTPEAVQNHIRWSAITAYDILDKHKDEYQRLIKAFQNSIPLEECIAIIEGYDDITAPTNDAAI